jgi:GT2 family glycosyltransferase
MKRRTVVPISVLILTHNRSNLLSHLLFSILSSSVLPTEICIIDSSDKKSDIRQFNSIFAHMGVNVLHIHTSNFNIPDKRNMALERAKNKICLYIDDDIILSVSAISKLFYLFKSNPLIAVAGGIAYPRAANNKASLFSFKLFYEKYLNKNRQIIRTDFVPTMLMGVRKSFVEKHNILFDTQLNALEDVDFCFQVREMGGEVVLDTRIKAKHAYRETLSDLFGTFQFYFSAISKLNSKHKIDFLNSDVYQGKKSHATLRFLKRIILYLFQKKIEDFPYHLAYEYALYQQITFSQETVNR